MSGGPRGSSPRGERRRGRSRPMPGAGLPAQSLVVVSSAAATPGGLVCRAHQRHPLGRTAVVGMVDERKPSVGGAQLGRARAGWNPKDLVRVHGSQNYATRDAPVVVDLFDDDAVRRARPDVADPRRPRPGGDRDGDEDEESDEACRIHRQRTSAVHSPRLWLRYVPTSLGRSSARPWRRPLRVLRDMRDIRVAARPGSAGPTRESEQAGQGVRSVCAHGDAFLDGIGFLPTLPQRST